MNRDLKRLFLFVMALGAVLITLDFITGKILRALYDRMTVGEKARANYFIKKDTSDVVIFGSSRALYHYHSGILADSLNMSVYNAGRSNQTILYHTAILKSILKRHQPKMVILDINEDEFVKTEKKYELLSALLPYYKYDDDIREMYDMANPHYKYWAWSHALPYNSSVFATLYRGLTRGKDKDIKGFLAHEGTVPHSLKTIDNCSVQYPLDSVLKETFHQFINVCRSKNIKLFIAVSPRFARYQCPRKEYAAIVEDAKQMNFSIHSFAEEISEPEYFSDPSHLNGKGAILYSKMIAKELRQFIHDH